MPDDDFVELPEVGAWAVQTSSRRFPDRPENCLLAF